MRKSEYKEFVFMRVFKAISSETRLKILLLLIKNNRLNVGDLQSLIRKSEPTVSIHLRKLTQARFVKGVRCKKQVFYKLVKEKRLVLNYEIIRLIETWFKKKKGVDKKREEKFIKEFMENLMKQNSQSY